MEGLSLNPNLEMLISALKVPVSWRCAHGGYVYDGESISLRRNEHYRYCEHHTLHEVFHWLIASEDQRMMPEYGMLLATGDVMANAKHLTRAEYFAMRMGVIPKDEQTTQEFLVQLLCVRFGRELDLNPYFRDFHTSSWEEYERKKCIGEDDGHRDFDESEMLCFLEAKKRFPDYENMVSDSIREWQRDHRGA